MLALLVCWAAPSCAMASTSDELRMLEALPTYSEARPLRQLVDKHEARSPPPAHMKEPGKIHNTATHSSSAHASSAKASPPPPPKAAQSLTGSELSLMGLFNTLFTTFGVIALGYVSKRTGFFSRDAKAGLGELVGKVALPALLFQAIATLKLSDLKPEFIVGVLSSKTLLWLLTVISARISGRNLSDAAMWAIFVSNSNDLAQGYPLFLTLYPAYSYQLFITAALQVAFLNPFAILLLEIDLARRSGKQTAVSTLVLRVVMQVLRNPLVLMVILGGVANVIWAGDPPELLTGQLGIFTILGSTFTGAALFLTGYVSARAQSSVSMGTPVYLTVLKSLIYPMMCRILVGQIGHSILGSTPDGKLLDLAFLYGTLPTAPSTIVIAQAHGAAPETIASAAVLNMVVSAPLSFTSTVLMTVSRLDLLEQAVAMISDVCCIGSAIGAAWVLLCASSAAAGIARRSQSADARIRGSVLLTATGGGRLGMSGSMAGMSSASSVDGDAVEVGEAGPGASRLLVIAHLAAAQLLFALSHLWCQTTDRKAGARAAWPLYLLVHTGRTACAAWTVLFAIQAAPLGRRMLTVPPYLRLAIGWGLPVAWAAACELLLERKNRPPFRCWMVYGRPQYAAEMVGLGFSLLLLASRMGALLRPFVSRSQRWAALGDSPRCANRPLVTVVDAARDDLEGEEIEDVVAPDSSKLATALMASTRQRLREPEADDSFNQRRRADRQLADFGSYVEQPARSDPGARSAPRPSAPHPPPRARPAAARLSSRQRARAAVWAGAPRREPPWWGRARKPRAAARRRRRRLRSGAGCWAGGRARRAHARLTRRGCPCPTQTTGRASASGSCCC